MGDIVERKVILRTGDIFHIIGSGRNRKAEKGVPITDEEEYVVIDPGSDQDDPLLVGRIETDNDRYLPGDTSQTVRVGPPTEFSTDKYYRIGTPRVRMPLLDIEKALALDAGGEIDPEDREALIIGSRRSARTLLIPRKKPLR